MRARDDGRRESGRDDRQDSEGENRKREWKIGLERARERMRARERGRGREGKREEGEGHFKHCPLVRKLNFESRTDH